MVVASPGSRSDLLYRLQSITDAALSRLSLPDLLNELLARLGGLLDVKVAAFLLLDRHAQQLVTTAARGLAEEVESGFRISVGRGFAGQVAHRREAVILTNPTAADLVSPHLRATGVQALAGVPMLAGDELIGVLYVGSADARGFTADDIELLEIAADRAGLAAGAQGSSVDRTAALALQRSLLPTRLLPLPGVELAARYVPGHHAGVGGDWYDVFALPGGWIGIAVGDVAGHGLASAVVMGRLRSALRAYALICDDPADVLCHLDRKVHHFEAGNMATVVYAMITPDRRTIHLSLAGHLPPMLVHPDGRVDMLTVPPDRPLGTGTPVNDRRRHSVPFPPDSVLVCYTDGLIERRGEIIDAGLERLRSTIRPGTAEEVCAAIMATIGDRQSSDDIALLAAHHRLGAAPALPPTAAARTTRATDRGAAIRQFTVTGDTIAPVRTDLRRYIMGQGMNDGRLHEILMAVHEIVTNAVVHGGGGAVLTMSADEAGLRVVVTDTGPGISPERLSDTDLPDAETMGGRGLWLARTFSDELTISTGPDGTSVTMTFRRS
jgi:anti-sigma regulatory factor (Ser/Thr protein kinase)/putative methionine-R-sulfoxide reductase with GAF domain